MPFSVRPQGRPPLKAVVMRKNNKKYNQKDISLICTALLFILLAVNINHVYSWSGTCSPIKDRLETASVIFSGKVIRVKTKFLDKFKKVSEPRIIVTFEIYKSWKGINGKKAMLHTVYNNYSSRGYYFKEGMELIVFAYKQENDTLDTNLYNVFDINNEEILQKLEEFIHKKE